MHAFFQRDRLEPFMIATRLSNSFTRAGVGKTNLISQRIAPS